MKKILQKLSSRKLWMAIAGIATGIAMVLGVDGSELTDIAGAVTAISSVVAYIVTEGMIDAEGVKKAVEATEKAVNTIEGGE